MGQPRPNNRTAEVILRDVEAVRLRAQHLTFSEIGAQLGINKSTAKRAVDRVLDHVQVEAADELRAQERAILAAARVKLLEIVYAHHVVVSNGKVTDQTDTAPVIAAIRELRQNSESLRKLDGLDAPSRSEVRVTDDLTAEIEQLAAELASAGDAGPDRSLAGGSPEGAAGPSAG